MNRFLRVLLLALLTATAVFLSGCAKEPSEDASNQNEGAARTPQAQTSPAQTVLQTGSIKITTRPGGADVLLIPEDESGAEAPQPKGRTPTLITDLSPGKYAVHLELRGYSPFQKSVEVKAGETTSVTATLKRQ